MITDEPCEHHCGYYSSGRDLMEHEMHEHRPCPDCGAGHGQDLDVDALTHKSDCVRLKPGHRYPPFGQDSPSVTGKETP